MASKQIVLTNEGLQKLEAELEQLKTVRRKEVSEKIKVALSFGDLSENSEYDEAKNNQGQMEARIKELEHIIKNAVVVDNDSVKTDKVSVGLKVKLYDEEFEEEIVYHIVGSTEADVEENKISDESQLGQNLIGKKVGDEVSYEAPCGEVKFKILEIFR